MNRYLKKLFGRTNQRELPLKEKYPQYEIGRGSYGHFRVRHKNEETTLKIGAFCSFAAGVQIFLGGEHRTDWVTTFPFPYFWSDVPNTSKGWAKTRGDVVIGNDVWIGTEALILSGVQIGNGAVIGARAVVTRNVPPYAIVVGVPAKVIRMRFDTNTIARLQTIAWWGWDDTKIASYLPTLLSGDVETFLSLAECDSLTFAPRSEKKP